jgi:hypothetical protein
MASKLAHAVVFAAGAAVGAGITSALVRSKHQEIPTKAQDSPALHSTSLVQVGSKGVPTLVQQPSEIIQFLGNPGTIKDRPTSNH